MHNATSLVPSKSLLAPYIPGVERAASDTRLNVNEVPWPPPPIEGMGSSDEARYPSSSGDPLVQELARFHGVSRDQIILGCGADGVLDGFLRAFVSSTTRVVLTRPTYALVPSIVDAYQGNVEWVDWHSEMNIVGGGEDVCVLTNPNAPTGEFLDMNTLERMLARFDGLVLLDEAYATFAPDSALSVIASHANWAVVRSFSKGFGLPGIRVGYGVASPYLVSHVRRFSLPYPVGQHSMLMASAALRDHDRWRRLTSAVLEGREELEYQLSLRGWRLSRSRANFVFGAPPIAPSEMTEALADRGILVRHFSGNGPEGIRVSVGSPTERAELFSALDALSRRGVS